MEALREAFAASCARLPGRITCREEWDAFTQRLVTSGLLDGLGPGDAESDYEDEDLARRGGRSRDDGGDDVAWCKAVWARTRPFGSSGQDLTFEDVLRFLRDDFADDLQGDPVLEAQRTLATATKQIASLARIVQDWAPDARQTRQMIDMALVLHEDLARAEEPVQALAQAQTSDFIRAATSPRRNGRRHDPTPFAFQEAHGDEIERRCAACRVRGTPARVDAQGRRRASPLKLSDKLGHAGRGKTLQTSLAGSSDGALVEVITLRGAGASDADIAFALNCHAAHRELVLSPYVPAWMGYSRSSELYYEHLGGCLSLASLLQRAGPMAASQPLLASVLSQALAALCDVLEQSTFALDSPVGPENVYVLDRGARLVLGGLAWGNKETCSAKPGPRGFEPFDVFAWQRDRERSFMGAFARILGACLGISVDTTPTAVDDAPASAGRRRAEVDCAVFARAQCDAGIRVSADTSFRMALLPSSPGKIWRCARLVDSGADPHCVDGGPLRSQIVALHDPDTLEFFASKPGLVRVYLQELDWWQDPGDLGRLGSASAPVTMMCKVSVVPAHAERAEARPSMPSQLEAVLTSCLQGAKARSGHFLGLRELQRRSALLDVDAIDYDVVQDDFHAYVEGGDAS